MLESLALVSPHLEYAKPCWSPYCRMGLKVSEHAEEDGIIASGGKKFSDSQETADYIVSFS